jgi:hypothetical protein
MYDEFIKDNMDKYKTILKNDALSDQQIEDVIRSLIYILDSFVEEAFQKPQKDHDLSSACAPSTEYEREDYQFSDELPKRTRTSNRLKYKRLLQKKKRNDD